MQWNIKKNIKCNYILPHPRVYSAEYQTCAVFRYFEECPSVHVTIMILFVLPLSVGPSVLSGKYTDVNLSVGKYRFSE